MDLHVAGADVLAVLHRVFRNIEEMGLEAIDALEGDDQVLASLTGVLGTSRSSPPTSSTPPLACAGAAQQLQPA